ncbi:MAG: signal peptidase I [Candidatus Paceibacterota bacterium]
MENPKKPDSWWEAIKFAIILVIIIIPFRLYIAQPFIVHGSSMDNTFKENDYLIIDEASYLFRNPERGEVIVFKNPNNKSQYFIKRVIGLPGEMVSVRNGQTIVTTTAGQQLKLTENYLGSANNVPAFRKLGPNEYFAMGDNRAVSWDSRFWGALPRELIKGRALVRLFPPQKIGYLPGEAEYLPR